MSKLRSDNSLTIIFTGAVAGTGIGFLLLQGLGAVLLGGLSTLGAWLVSRFIIPYLNKKFPKK